VIGVRSEVEPRAGVAAQRAGQTADEVLRLDERDLLATLGEREAGGEAADAAANNYGVTQRGTSERFRVGIRG
jgi:hypothetical protein